MRYIDEFRDKKLVMQAARNIAEIMPPRTLRIMEVCGTHTHNFRRFGLEKLLPKNLEFVAGPGCPVCVSDQGYIDSAIRLAQRKEVIIATFGDMLRVPGTKSSLERQRAKGANISLVYSPLDALRIARENKSKKVIFLAIGFETTAPAIALSILAAKKEKLKNLSFFCALKLMPPAMRHLLNDCQLGIDAFLCPGHVSSIIGIKPYEFIPKRYGLPCCVAGFEPLDILEGIYSLLKQINQREPRVTNEYARIVKREGNLKAVKIIRKVFKAGDASWRGLGRIANSGLVIKDGFSNFNTEKIFSLKRDTRYEIRDTRCKCGDVLKGLILPSKCPLFAKACLPERPIGPCMVANEGACNAYYKYR